MRAAAFPNLQQLVHFSESYSCSVIVYLELTGTSDGSHVGVTRLDESLVLGDRIEHRVRQVERVLDDLAGRQREPLRGADVGELLGLKYFQEDDILSARVLNVVTRGLLDVANIAGREVERLRGRRRLVYGDARRPLQEVGPLIAFSMPVDFAHRARFEHYERR